jgi:hypothetical protein
MNTKTDPQSIDPKRVTALLTHAVSQLDDNTLTALKRARGSALERQVSSQPVMVSNTGWGMHWPRAFSARQWLMVSMLVMAALVGYMSYWHHEQEAEISQADVAILTDDMPLEVFIDDLDHSS